MAAPQLPPDISLTLVFPEAIEEQIVDLLLDHDNIVAQFNSVHVDAHGSALAAASVAEQVRGRSWRSQCRLLMRRDDLPILLAALEAALPRAGITYWAVPLLVFGRLS